MRRIILSIMISMLMTGCVTNKKTAPGTPPQQIMSPATASELEQGKRLFQDGYYKRALRVLLPLAAEGSMEAQYAVGYMYYYGLGSPQDTESGYFWIKRSADQHFQPAINALTIIQQQQKNKR